MDPRTTTKVLFLDGEQADLVAAAAAMANAAMDARARRIDPEGVVSKSARMSEIKLRHVLSQLDMPPMADWSDLPEFIREAALAHMQEFMKTDDPEIRASTWRELQSLVILRAGLFDPAEATQLLKEAGV